MAREYSEIEVTRKERRLTKIACDICGTEAKNAGWGGGSYEVNEVEIDVRVHHREGEQYPEGGDGTEYTIDMCPRCFVDKLVPFVESFGRKIERKEWDC